MTDTRPYTPPQIYRAIARDIRENRLKDAARKLESEAARSLRILDRNELQRQYAEKLANLMRA